jgi:sucrose phosphorylase
LTFLYGEERSRQLPAPLERILASHRARLDAQDGELSGRDAILITYADQVQKANEKPLQTLHNFCSEHLEDVISGIHILPFYPSTSDDGFSVSDYRRVDADLGSWDDLAALRQHFRLMFDAVINHVSVQSGWFQTFLSGEPRTRDYFITVTGSPDLSQVVRPRTLPLLTSFHTQEGEKQVWTTFSADQVDLNYHNPEVLLEILDVLLFYVEQGASFIRLDAVAYLWKEPGTTCINLPQTHQLIQFLRAVLDHVAPSVQLVTETNVPHEDNLSYFGDGTNEAQLVYNFALPPLVLHTFHTEQAGRLSRWAGTLRLPTARTTFFNFLASHDGIGVTPVKGILSVPEIQHLVDKTIEHGGLVSYKQEANGPQSPYELNINYFDALSNPCGEESLELQVDRFMAAQAILLCLVGMPGIYFHSLFGSRGWMEGVKQTGHNRTINRQKCLYAELQDDLVDGKSLRARVFTRFRLLLTARAATPAFHPHGSQVVLDFHPNVFALERISPNGNFRALCLQNVSRNQVHFRTDHDGGQDLLSGRRVSLSEITLEPHQTLWVTP